MLKTLLFISMSLLLLAGYAQNALPEQPRFADSSYDEDPVKTVSHLTATVNDQSKVVVTWRVDGNLPDFFAIERSNNNKDYEVIAILNKPHSPSYFQWIDEAPKAGKSQYRLRYAYDQGKVLYSSALSVSIAGNTSFKFYPNPVDHILIVRSESPLDVMILDANGKLRIFAQNIQGLHTLQVSTLEKGIYLIRFINKLTNVMWQEKLAKN